jgi:hypothetical protein
MALLVPLAELDDDELLFVKDFQARISDATSSNYKKSIECPLWVRSGSFATALSMSAFGGKADKFHDGSKGPLIAISGH